MCNVMTSQVNESILAIDELTDFATHEHGASILKAKGTQIPYERAMLKVLLKSWGEASNLAVKKAITKLNGVKGVLGHADIHNVTELLRDTINVSFLKNTQDGVPVLFDKAYRAGKKSIVDKMGVFMKWEHVDAEALYWLENHHMYWIESFYDKHLSSELSRYVKEGLQEGLGRKDIGKRLKEFFESFEGAPIKPAVYWRGFAANGMNRARNFGLIQGYQDVGVKYLQVLAVMDERTSNICRNLNGKRYPVWAAASQRDMLMNAQDPEDVKIISPWPKIDDIVTKGRVHSTSSLIGSGVIMPPYHFHCRTTMIEVFT